MIYLHIGLPKSGSSAVQVYLNENYELLMGYGFIYPWPHGYSQRYRTSGGNAKPILSVARNGYPDEEVSSVKVELEELASKYEKVIISSEALSVFFKNPEDVTKFMPENSDIKIIIYLRNQVDKFLSDVNQTIKNAKRDSYEIGTVWLEFNNYYKQIKRWEKVFGEGNVIVRGYDKQQFPNADVVADFCDVVGIPYLGYDRKTPINPSLNLTHLEIMRQVNLLAKEAGPEGWKLKQYIKNFIWESSVEGAASGSSKDTYVSKEVLTLISEHLTESNYKVSEEYGVTGLDLDSAITKYNFVKPDGSEKVCAEILFSMATSVVGDS